jgi:hypothetical protein
MRRFQPALLGGLFIGVLSSLPFVSALNLCCCLWVVSGGVLTTYLLQQNRPDPVESSEAALQGLVAGFIGGVIAAAVVVAFIGLSGVDLGNQLRVQFEQNAQIPSDVRDRLEAFANGRNIAIVEVLIFVPTFAVFGLLGGLLGLPFFRRKPPAVPQDGVPSV